MCDQAKSNKCGQKILKKMTALFSKNKPFSLVYATLKAHYNSYLTPSVL
ncbi:hypothetical protein NT05HA_0116 [Aggregatibacter aphrophilus NJ8700]|nr:hypothetical protein NT05HA_0116 [Aggregatibacter aphrophilus NJ8700]